MRTFRHAWGAGAIATTRSMLTTIVGTVSLATCIADTELGDLAKPCTDDADCGALQCFDGRCFSAVHVGGDGDENATLCAPGPATRDELVLTASSTPEDLLGVRCVLGDVVVEADVESMAPLAGLEEIRGELQIIGAGLLADVSMPALREVQGSVRVGGIDVDADGAVTTSGNPSLLSIDVPALRAVGKHLIIAGNPMLQVVHVGSDPSESTKVGQTGTVTVSGSLVIYGNDRFGAQEARLFFQQVNDTLLYVENNGQDGASKLQFPYLEDVGSLPVSDGLRLDDITVLQTDGVSLVPQGSAYFGLGTAGSAALDLPALRSVGQRLAITGPNLEELTLPALEEAGAFDVADAPALASINAPELLELTGSSPAEAPALYLSNLQALVSIGFDQLTTIHGKLVIQNTGLSSLCGLSSLTEVTGDMDIRFNDQGLERCEVVALWEQTGSIFLQPDDADDAEPPACGLGCTSP